MDSQIASVVIKKFAKRAQTKLAIMAAVKSLDGDDDINVAEIKDRLDEALAIDNADSFNDAYDYFTNPMQRLQADKDEPRIATKLSAELDKSINGGLAAGEIGIVIAPTKVGKTMLLINLAYNAMIQGKKVVYVTLELRGNRIASRFDQRITCKPFEELTYPMIYRKTRMLAAKGAGLMIKDSVSYRMSPNDLALYLERLKKDFPFDLIVVDQLSLMHTPKEYKDRRHELSATCIGLRRVGARFGVPVWAAHQATRIAGERGNTTLWDVSEDIGIANWSDLIVALSQQKEDKEDNIIFLEVVGNRIGPTNAQVTLKVDYPKMKLKAITKKETEDEG
jgi:replicative DNA helicase